MRKIKKLGYFLNPKIKIAGVNYMKKILRTISLFSGCGGLDLGFEKAGFKIIFANDIDEDSCISYMLNFKDTFILKGNIRNVNSDDIPDGDIIIGGFPCQGFSLAGPRLVTDDRNSLYKEFVRVLQDKKPLAFVAENVKGILTLDKGKVVNAIIRDFRQRGYIVSYKLINSKECGVAQDRQRVFFVGIRKDLKLKYSFPQPSGKQITLKVVLKSLNKPEEKDICRQPYSSRYMSRNRKKGQNDISFTIPAMAKQVPLHPSSPNMIKNGKDNWKFGKGTTRRFSYKEALVIQGFPKNFKVYGNLISKYSQVGNAVPPPMAEVIARELNKTLSEVRKMCDDEFNEEDQNEEE